jgi:predicted DNA binding protein
MTVKISENQLVNGHASALQNELQHSRKVSEETSQRLATTAYDLENLEKMKVELVRRVSDFVSLGSLNWYNISLIIIITNNSTNYNQMITTNNNNNINNIRFIIMI